MYKNRECGPQGAALMYQLAKIVGKYIQVMFRSPLSSAWLSACQQDTLLRSNEELLQVRRHFWQDDSITTSHFEYFLNSACVYAFGGSFAITTGVFDLFCRNSFLALRVASHYTCSNTFCSMLTLFSASSESLDYLLLAEHRGLPLNVYSSNIVSATPFRPALPVLPMRWIYSVMCIGMS